ncbi:MAG: hypothetical protein M3Z15_07275 [Pseudomonadota bacterium]|nr:hypothetical protein [Pseudomonadota bacterium]
MQTDRMDQGLGTLERQSLLPVFGKDTTGDDRQPMFWEHEGTRRCASASGSS